MKRKQATQTPPNTADTTNTSGAGDAGLTTPKQGVLGRISNSAARLNLRKKQRGAGKIESSPTSVSLPKMKAESDDISKNVINQVIRFQQLQQLMAKAKADAEYEENGIATITIESSSSSSTKIDENTNVLYMVNGRVGNVKFSDGMMGGNVLTPDDIRNNLHKLPPSLDTPEKEKTRMSVKHEVFTYGASQCWVRAGTRLVGLNYLNTLKKSFKKYADMFDSMESLFDAKQCQFSPEFLTLLAASGVLNFGGSDEAAEMMIAMVLKGFLNEIGFKISHEQLANAIPSRRTLARYEHILATDCILKVIHEIRKDGATKIGIITDHGHRGGQDHFVIVVIWSGKDEEGRRTLKAFCPSIDSAGHTAAEAANGVKSVFDRFLNGVVSIQGEKFNVSIIPFTLTHFVSFPSYCSIDNRNHG